MTQGAPPSAPRGGGLVLAGVQGQQRRGFCRCQSWLRREHHAQPGSGGGWPAECPSSLSTCLSPALEGEQGGQACQQERQCWAGGRRPRRVRVEMGSCANSCASDLVSGVVAGLLSPPAATSSYTRGFTCIGQVMRGGVGLRKAKPTPAGGASSSIRRRRVSISSSSCFRFPVLLPQPPLDPFFFKLTGLCRFISHTGERHHLVFLIFFFFLPVPFIALLRCGIAWRRKKEQCHWRKKMKFPVGIGSGHFAHNLHR